VHSTFWQTQYKLKMLYNFKSIALKKKQMSYLIKRNTCGSDKNWAVKGNAAHAKASHHDDIIGTRR